jgi:dihydroneopterin aldolase
MLDKIILAELAVWYRVGVTDEERSAPQRLLLNVVMERDLAAAAASDDLTDTIDYFAVAQRLLNFGEDRTWNLIEKVAADVADFLLAEFQPQSVSIEVRKFVIHEAAYVAVRLTRTASSSHPGSKTRERRIG